MTLRFLCTGDLQIHPWKQFSTTLKNGMNSRLANCLKVFDILKQEGEKRGIRKILLNGDLLEETDFIQVEVYDATYRALEALYHHDFQIAINLGNHDIAARAPKRVLHTLRPFRKVAQIIEAPQILWNLIFVIPNSSTPEELKKQVSIFARKAEGMRPSCLILHEGVRGSQVGPSDYRLAGKIRLPDLRPKKFDLVLLSDFHTQQFLRKNVLYLGSPLQHTFGETHDPCIWDVTLLEEKPYFKLRKIPTDFPRFMRVLLTRGKLEKLWEEAGAKDFPLRGNYVEVIITDRIDERQVEELARKGRFLFRISRRSEAQPLERPKGSGLHKHLRRYVLSRAKGKRQERLISLGERLLE